MFDSVGNVKLIDFGLSRKIRQLNNYTMVGTPIYLAPEVITGQYDYKCDIWSLGVCIFYALTGEFPYFGESVEVLFNKILVQDPDYSKVPENSRQFLRDMLNKNRNQRLDAATLLRSEFLS